ncbi:aminopeptidase N-like isoform X2 [Symsagittifera roscoffensis]|uniref:aminopeptidase N-like isoform X2 n=1 Tax=Symsagittifera roscoffensis TaxID=84072 RepID=UPI00307BD919
MAEDRSSSNGTTFCNSHASSKKCSLLRTRPESRSESNVRSYPRCLIIALVTVIIILFFIITYLIFLHYHCAGLKWPWAESNSLSLEGAAVDSSKYVRLPEKVLPDHYEILLKVQMPDLEDKLSFNGTVQIQLTVAEDTREIKLNAHKSLSIISCRLTGYHNRKIHIQKFDYTPSEDMITLRLSERIVKSNQYNLSMTFRGSPHPGDVEGIYSGNYERTEYVHYPGNKTKVVREIRWFAVTQMEPAAARKLFPCFDEPIFKATFSIAVVYQSEYNVLSNMPVVKDEVVPGLEGWNRIHFQRSVRMSTYLVAIAITTFQSRQKTVQNMDNETVPITVWAMKAEIDHTSYALRVASESYVFFEKFYQIPYALPKMDLISVPNFNVGGMENWGLITFRPFYLVSKGSEESHYGICKVVNHEIAHQWFGNLVTPKWWNDIWLNEGFATFMEYVGMDAIEGEWDVWSLFFVDATMEVFSSDSLVSSHPVVHEKQIANRDDLKMFFDLISYRKGGAILRMLRSILGQQGFKQGVLLYLDRFQFSSATSEDLWNSFEQSRNRSEIPHSITEMMTEWTLQLGYPLVTMHVDYGQSSEDSVSDSSPSSNPISVTLSQRHFITNLNYSQQYLEKTDSNWWHIKIDFITSDGQTHGEWLTKEPKNITIELNQTNSDNAKVRFILANSRCEHFYRVNYDIETWRRIVDALREDSSVLDSATKSCLIDNSWELLGANELSADIALDLTILSVQNDTSYPLWKTVEHHLEIIYTLMYRSGEREKFQTYCEQIVNISLEAETNLSRSDFQATRKTKIKEFANFIGHPQFIAQSVSQAEYWVASIMGALNESSERVMGSGFGFHVDIHDYQLCAAAKAKSTDFSHLLHQLFLSGQVNPQLRSRLIRGFACTNDATLFNHILDQAIGDINVPDGTQWKNDELGYLIITGAGKGTNAGFNVVWNYFSIPEKFDKFGYRFKDFTFFFKNILFAVYSGQDSEYALQSMKKFNETHFDKLGAGQAEFYRLIERVENNVQWSKYARPQVIHWLNQFFD